MKFDESTLGLIAVVFWPFREVTVTIDVDGISTPKDMIAFDIFIADLNLNIEELKFVLDNANSNANRIEKNTERSRKLDVVIDSDSHCKVLCLSYIANISTF